MSPVVLDCSYAMAMVMPDEHPPQTAEQVLGMDLIAPALWSAEVASAALSAMRRKRMDAVEARRVCQSVLDLGVQVQASVALEPEHHLQSALTHDLTPYDAAYVELAVQRRATLATLDAKMIKAALKVGLRVLS